MSSASKATDFSERFMDLCVDIAKAEIKARFHGGSFEEIEDVGRQKERAITLLRSALSDLGRSALAPDNQEARRGEG